MTIKEKKHPEFFDAFDLYYKKDYINSLKLFNETLDNISKNWSLDQFYNYNEYYVVKDYYIRSLKFIHHINDTESNPLYVKIEEAIKHQIIEDEKLLENMDYIWPDSKIKTLELSHWINNESKLPESLLKLSVYDIIKSSPETLLNYVIETEYVSLNHVIFLLKEVRNSKLMLRALEFNLLKELCNKKNNIILADPSRTPLDYKYYKEKSQYDEDDEEPEYKPKYDTLNEVFEGDIMLYRDWLGE